MLPTITIFGKIVAMYGLTIVIGIFIGIAIALLRRKRHNIDKDDIIFSACYAGIGLIIGAKLIYIITIIPGLIANWDLISSDIHNLLYILTSGFVFYGGLIGAVIGYYIYCRQYKIDFIKLIDLMAPSIPIIHGIGRIGCFFAGCCYGIRYEGYFHLIFKNSPVAPNGIALFPIQLLESMCNIVAGVLLIIYARKDRKPGQVIGLYIIYYSIARFLLEFLRGDIMRGVFLHVSTSQWISLAMLPIGLYLLLGHKEKKNN